MASVGSLEALDSSGGASGGGRARHHEIQRGDSLLPVTGQGRDARGERLRTRTLIVMRLLAVVGQAGALAILTVGLKIKAPILPCFLLIGASAMLNLILMAAPVSRRFARPWEAAAQLVFDTVQLGGLLYFTGGVANPFCVLMIVPVTVAGATLPERYALPIGILSGWLIVVLAVTALPLPWAGGHALHLPVLYRVGWVLALLLVMGVTAGFAFWTAGQTARMERALLATETVLAREQRLSALGALAAAAAHELGTPLATISVVAKELAHVTEAGPRREDAFLLVAEAQRCRGILSRLAESPESADTMRERMSLAQLLEEVTAPFRGDKRVRIITEVEGPEKVEAPQMWRQREVVHALTAFVENAFDFAKQEIEVTAHYTARHITLGGARRWRRVRPGNSRPTGRTLCHHPTGRRGFPYRPHRYGSGFFHRQDPARAHRCPGGIQERPPRRRAGQCALDQIGHRSSRPRLGRLAPLQQALHGMTIMRHSVA